MMIDKTRFLALVAVIATAGCSSAKTDSGGGNTDAGGSGGAGGVDVDAGVGGSGGSGGTDAAPTCNDTDATGVTTPCPIVEGGTTLPPACLYGYGVDVCANTSAYLKPRVAAKVAACVGTVQGATQATCAAGIPICIEQNLSASCPDPTAESVCQQIFDSCATAGTPPTGAGSASVADCTAYVSGLSDAGRTKFVACFTSGASHGCQMRDCYSNLVGL